MGKSQELYKKAKKIIPGGTQLFSKRPEMFLPEYWPAYYAKAKGCVIWDLDHKKYIDMSYMALGACILGYADSDVNRAVRVALENGNMSTLNAPEEVELAQLLIKLHPWSGMVRYARTGGEAMAIAVRIARAKTRRDMVLFCGYHGWHDWYLCANLSYAKALDKHLLAGLNPLGVPRKLAATAYPFSYNDLDGFLRLIKRHKGKIGAVIIEPIRNKSPELSFIKMIRKVTRELGIVLIVDEVSAGFRLNAGGAHMVFNLKPDIAVFAKGMSNGLPMAAVIGRKEVMKIAQDTFISSTYWTDRIGPAAALATIKKIISKNVSGHLIGIGKEVQDGWKKIALKYNIKIDVSGIYPLSHFSFLHDKPLVLKTLFTQVMLEKGFLATTSFYASYAHTYAHIGKYLSAVADTFKFIRRTALINNDPEKYLKGPVCHAGFKRLT